MKSSNSSGFPISGSSSSTGSNKIIIAIIAVAIAIAALILALWACYRRRRVSRPRTSNSQITEYVDYVSNLELSAIEANETLLSSSSNRKWFSFLPLTSSVSSMEVNDQINTCTAPKTINVTTAIATGSSPVEIDSQLETYDIKDENSLDIVALEQSRLLPQSVLDDILLHKGSFTMTFRATLKIEGQANRHVVVRRLLPELAELEAHRLAFMGSISLAAALAHPNIVAFMGVYDPTLREYNLDEFLSPSWQDTQPSVVTEHMANGDLRTMLRLHSRNKNEFGWFHSTSVPKTKVQVALDIVDALVYLHSQPNTLLHHLQLMAKRVLLSELWDAKLCAFSVHRALGTASTTSCTDSSVAWLAPELLRGEPRSEQTDVYALGVLLTELDTCQLPFSLGMDMDDEMDEQTQLALLVSSGCIRPALSIDCPLQIQELVMRCLSFSPEQRSPAIEVQHMLRKLINGTSICNLSLSSLPSNVSSLESITID